MPKPNPNQRKDTSNRIYNRFWAIFFVIFGFGPGALIAVWLWTSWGGGGGLFTDLSATSEWLIDVTISIVLGIAAILLVWIGFAAPVFWSEIGDKLRFRKLLGVQTREWSEVKAMEFAEDQGGDRTLRITLVKDDEELAVVIPPSHYQRIVKLGARRGFMPADPAPAGGPTQQEAPESSDSLSKPPARASKPPRKASRPSRRKQRRSSKKSRKRRR